MIVSLSGHCNLPGTTFFLALWSMSFYIYKCMEGFIAYLKTNYLFFTFVKFTKFIHLRTFATSLLQVYCKLE